MAQARVRIALTGHEFVDVVDNFKTCQSFQWNVLNAQMWFKSGKITRESALDVYQAAKKYTEQVKKTEEFQKVETKSQKRRRRRQKKKMHSFTE